MFLEQHQTPPNPTVVIPFPRDEDFVRRNILCHLVEDLSAKPDSWVALVGLGGVG